ncbi:MAG: hypothetical protein WCF95_04820 [bacterium]
MNKLKKDFFETLSKIQKSSLISYLKKFIVKKKNFDETFLYEEFLEEQHYYIKIGQPYFGFIADFIEEVEFLRDLKFCIKDLCFKQKQKELQKPFLEKQKLFVKEQRKKAQEFKMSHEKPSPKQLSYYKSLCKKQNIEPVKLDELSKLDLKNMIAELLKKD